MRVKLHGGRSVECDDRPIARGGVGEVHVEADGRHVIKLFIRPRDGLRQSLERIVDDYRSVGGEPEWTPWYRWPIDVVVEPRLGVRLPRLDHEQAELTWLVNGKALVTRPAAWRSWQLRLQVARSLAMAVHRLHGEGLAHSDLSTKNVYFDPRDGTVTLIDIDGIVVPGVNPPQVIGTPDYIAPEIVADPGVPPSIRTDQHSLAVLVYQLLLYRHPLRGPRVVSSDPADDDRNALGPDGVYVDHPGDHSNRPVKALWDGFWPGRLLGLQIATLFDRTFVAGLRNPGARPTAGEWLGALTRLVDRVVACSGADCPERYFPLADGLAAVCPWCRTALSVPAHTPALHLYQSSDGSHYAPDPAAPWWMVGVPGRKLHDWHTTKGVNVTPKALARAPLAVIEHEAPAWTLRNLDLPELRVIRDGQERGSLGRGDAVRLDDGATFLLGPPPRGRALVVSRFER